MAVAVARPLRLPDAPHVDVEVTLRSLVRLIQQSLPPAIGKLVEVRNDEATLIVSADGDPGRALWKELRRWRIGPARVAAAGLGISSTAAELAGLPERLEEARIAVEFAATARPLVHFADIDLSEFLIRRTDRAALRLVPEWAAEWMSGGAAGELSRTVRVFTECSLNVKQTARRLGVHTNTVYFRLNRIHKLTGLDPRTFRGASLLLNALRLVETHGLLVPERNHGVDGRGAPRRYQRRDESADGKRADGQRKRDRVPSLDAE
jgi:hypothetical protein